MKIKLGNFILEPEVNSPTKWNIRELKKIQSGENKGQDNDTIISYGTTLAHAIEVIAHINMMEKEETVSLMQWVRQYTDMLKSLEDLLKAHLTSNVKG